MGLGGWKAPWKKLAPRRFAAEGSTRREAIPPTEADRLPPSGTLHGAPERGRGEGEGFMTLVDETTVVESRFEFTGEFTGE